MNWEFFSALNEEQRLAAIEAMPREMKVQALGLWTEQQRRYTGRAFYRMYPDEGPLRRALYGKHIEFFELGATKPFRLASGGNGIGKTWGIGCFEVTCHLTGKYPDWWAGKRYKNPVYAVIAGKTRENVRDIIQPKLVGRRGEYGTGMIPMDCLNPEDVTMRHGSNGAIDNLRVLHVSGGYSTVQFKSYDMGPESFMGFEADIIWLDEPPPADVYGECAQRFRTRDPCMLITFTPLEGIDQIIQMFIPEYSNEYDEEMYQASGRCFMFFSQDEAPHLSAEEKKRLLASCLPHEREARQTGRPSIGIGKIYPFAEESFVIDPLPNGIPPSWKRLYALDPGLRTTAVIWLAHDLDTDTIYAYSEHYSHDQLPPVHASAIKMRGGKLPGVIDPASLSRNQLDGERLYKMYTDQKVGLGLRLRLADNAVETGIYEVYHRLETGRLKVVRTLTNFLREFRLYRRDDNGRIVKQDDHLMDALRYGVAAIKYAEYPRSDQTRTPAMHENTFGIFN